MGVSLELSASRSYGAHVAESRSLSRAGWFKPIQEGAGSALLDGAVTAFERALHAKDPDTVDHSDRVGTIAVGMARHFGLRQSVVCDIAIAARLHDIGKIGVPDELLHKPGHLTMEERLQILEHTVIGGHILAPVFADRPVVLAVVRSHHERVDGTGYPDGMRGEQIPLVARIVSVADAFDAMISERPYRPARPRREAIEELLRCSGTHFDPQCVRALLEVCRPGMGGQCSSQAQAIGA